MTTLSQYKQMDYELLVPWFEKMLSTHPELNCAEIARQSNIGHAQVLSHFSRYLVQLQHEIKEEAERCPSCGKLKHEVTDPTVCRDVIHYL